MPIRTLSRLFLVCLALTASAGCELAEGIFKAGVGVGIFMVIVVVGLVFFLVAKIRA
jgi:hypothetical protein